MSSDSAQWPVVAPGFMYIVRMGDFTHILQPADQKSSENLNLAQTAIRDINVARRLLNERGPFLLLDKQQKMDELISETENAINRVIKILEPSRVEHISEQSIRFNTRNPWALENDPKSAATFSRLHITHDALKTVVHDLNNIEATAQMEDCDTRANPVADIAIARPPPLSHPPATGAGGGPASTAGPTSATNPNGLAGPTGAAVAVARSPSKDARHLITWKRSRRANRHARNDQTLHNVQSNTSSVSETTIDDRDLNDILSPVSPEARFTSAPVGTSSTRPRRESLPTPASLLQSDLAHDHASDASGLPVIHELEGGGAAIVKLGPVRPPSPSPTPTTNGHARAASDAKASTLLAQTQKVVNNVTSGHGRDVKSSNHQSTPSNSAPALRVTPPTLKHPNRVKRDTFEEHRQRGRESRQLANSFLTNGPQLSSVGEHGGMGKGREEPADSVHKAPGRFHSLNARSPASRINPNGAIQADYGIPNGVPSQIPNGGPSQVPNGGPSQVPNGQPVLPPSGLATEESRSIMSPIVQTENRGRQEFRENGESSVRSAKSATYPPLQTQLHPPVRNEARVNANSLGSSNQILSPSRIQMSPHEQIQSPDTSQSAEPPQLQPHLRNPQIFAIDPELTKMPSVLRAARARQEARSRPISQANSKQQGEFYSTENSLADPVKNPLDRSTTAPPLLNVGGEDSDAFSQDLPTRDEFGHLRSMSETAVPQINVVRAPTIPRKPLPYRNSNSPSPVRNVSPVNVSRIGTPYLQRPQSELIESLSNMQRTPKPTSGPPSPVHSEHPGTLKPQRPRATSLQSLSVQASAGSSRRSSISAEEPVTKSPSAPERSPKTNGLAMNPPNVSGRQTSAYQAQKMAQQNQPAQVAVQTQDYNSPAWLQARHYFGSGQDKPLGQAPAPNVETTSRFRDQDQSKPVPVNPSRSQTTPLPSQDNKAQVSEAEKPVRSPGQAHKLLPSQQAMNGQSPPKPSSSPRPADQSKPSFLHHQAAKLDARQRLNPDAQPVVPPRAEQVLPPQQPPQPPPPPPRIVLTPLQLPEMNRTAPKVDPKNKARTVPAQPVNHGRPASEQSTLVDKTSVKDKDLFGRQVFRPSKDKQPATATISSIPPQPAAPAPAPPTATATVTPTPAPGKVPSHHAQATVPQHDCHCDDEPQPTIDPPSNPTGTPHGLPQNVPGIAPPETNPDTTQATSTSKHQKKKSWLAHQAGKIAARPGH